MKRILLLTTIIFASLFSFSQDTIIKINHDTIIAEVLNINKLHIEYSLQNDSIIHLVEIEETQQINYESSRIHEFNTINKFDKGANKGYRLIGELALGYNYPNTSIGCNISVINGYQFNKYIFAGLNIGLKSLIPDNSSLFGETMVRLAFFNSDVSPYIDLSVGMSHLYEYNFFGYNSIFPSSSSNLLSAGIGIGIQSFVTDKSIVNLGFSVETLPYFNDEISGNNIIQNDILVCFNIGISVR